MERYEAYKDSGVEWIGEIPAEWKTRRLKLLGTTRSGMSNKKPDDFGAGRPFLSYKDVYSQTAFTYVSGLVESTEEDRERYSVLRGDAFFTGSSETIEELGFSSVCLASIPNATFNGFTIRFRPHEDCLYPEYSAYLFRSEVFRGYLRQRDNSITRANLSQQILGDALVILPSADEQRAIADYLDAKTDKIDELVADYEREVELLQEYRKAVISEAVTKGLDPNAAMKDSGIEWIGEIPEGWDAGKILQHAKLESGHTPSKAHPEWWIEEECVIPWVTTQDVHRFRDGRIRSIDDTQLHISNIGLANSSARWLPKGTVALSRTASVGFSIVLTAPMATSQDFANWIPDDFLDSFYLLYSLRSMEPVFKQLQMGSTHKTIYMPDIRKLSVAYPPLPEQRAIVEYLDAKTAQIDSLIDAKRQMVEKLREYRKSLISEAVTGKFKVPGVN